MSESLNPEESLETNDLPMEENDRDLLVPKPNFDPTNGTFSYVENPAVVLVNVSKRYSVSSSGASADAAVRNGGRNSRYVDALKQMSLVVTEGESIGFIGLNGSGKSTLCNLIAGAQAPTTGEIYTSSTPTLLGVGAALQGNLTGEQNIILGLLALGLGKAEAKSMVGSIAEWVDIGEGITRPLSTYSSGMAARLRFAISTAVKPKILVIDEGLATGDVSFTAKAEERMQETLDRAGSLILVSHSVGQIEKNCARAVWLHKGEVIMDGPSNELSPLYHEWARKRKRQDNPESNAFLEECKAVYTPPVVYLD